MTVSSHHTIAELELESQRTRDAKAKLRLLAIVLAKEGASAASIGRRLGIKTQTIDSWVRRYNRVGLVFLQDAPRAGRPLRMSDEQLAGFRRRLEAGPRPEDQVCSLRGVDFQRILKEEFGVTYSLNGVYWLLHYLGYSSLMPRSKHKQSDPEAQEAFKKSSRTS